MKKIIAATLFAAAAIGLQAAPNFRTDISGVNDKVALKGEKTANISFENPGWVKTGKECYLSFWTVKPLSTTAWSELTISFTPAQTGKVTVRLLGQWAAKPEAMEWVLVNQVKLDGKLYPNGDFKSVTKNKDGKEIPSGFYLSGTAKYLAKAGEKDTPALLVNHNNGAGFTMQVEANKTYKFEFKVKGATPELLK